MSEMLGGWYPFAGEVHDTAGNMIEWAYGDKNADWIRGGGWAAQPMLANAWSGSLLNRKIGRLFVRVGGVGFRCVKDIGEKD